MEWKRKVMVGGRAKGEGDGMDLIKMHYMHIGNSQTIKE